MNITPAPIILIVAIVLAVLLIGSFIGTYNKLRRGQVKVQEADSGIDVALTKRYDVLAKLLDTVREYTKYEQTVVLTAVRLRQGMTMEEKQQATNQMDEAATQIKLLAEAYPSLSAQTVFMQLQHAAMDSEEHLQAARRLYNSNVSLLNQMIATFPTNMIAGMAGIKAAPMFVAEEAKRNDVSLRL